MSLISRLLDGCVGCGREIAAVAVGPADNPDETYGARCWADDSLWAAGRPEHTHVDGRACDCGLR